MHKGARALRHGPLFFRFAPTARAMGAVLPRPRCAQAFRAPFRRKKRGLRHAAAHTAGPRALSRPAKPPPHAPSPAAAGASPRPPLAPWVRSAPASCAPAFRVSRGHKKRDMLHPPPRAAGPPARTSPSEVWRAAALQNEIRIRRHARRIRQPCASKATLRRPPLAPERSACPVGTWAEGPKRLGGVSKYKGCARPARRTPIFARCRRQSRRLSRRTAQPRRKRPPQADFFDAHFTR